MKTKEYLSQYKAMKGRIDRYKDRIQMVENVLRSVNLDGMPRGTKTGDPTKNAAINLALLKDQYGMAILEAEAFCAKITAEIERVPDEKCRELLFARYIRLESWQDITIRMDRYRPGREYELKSVIGYMHPKALRMFEEANK